MIVLKGIKTKGLMNDIVKKKDAADPIVEGGSLNAPENKTYIKQVPMEAPQQNYFDNLDVWHRKLTEEQLNNVNFRGKKKNTGVKINMKDLK